MVWKIVLEGCDDHTSFYIEEILTNDQEIFLKKLVALAAKTSEYSCMPTISAYQIKDEDYLKFREWEKVDKIYNSFDSNKITKEQKDLHSQHYNEYWLERVAIKKHTPEIFKF